MATVFHPKCGRRFPAGSRAGHCAACCSTFIGVKSFEEHRVGSHDARRCQLQPYRLVAEDGRTRYGHWQDERGYWRFGRQLTEEERAELWG